MSLIRLLTIALLAAGAALTGLRAAEPLKVAYSDWPGWVAWEVGIQKGWFKEAGVDVDFVWFEYVPSMEALAAGQVDACCMTNGDALVTGATGKHSVGILLNDYSNGNDMIVAKPGIASMKDLKGKKIGVEVGFVDHLLLLKALEANGMSEADVEIINIVTTDTPQALASGQVDAIAAWQPSSGQALAQVPGSKAIFSSADVKGVIYDALYVTPESLNTRRADWAKVVSVWPRIVAFIQDPATQPEALQIMAARVGLDAATYKPLLAGTFLLDAAGNKKHSMPGDGLESVFGSTVIVNAFNEKNGVYDAGAAGDLGSYFDASLVNELK